MTDPDDVADLADRTRAMSEFQFAIEWAALTDAERDEFMALMHQRRAHGKEKLEALPREPRGLASAFRLSGGSYHRAGVRRAGPWRGARPVGAEPGLGRATAAEQASVH